MFLGRRPGEERSRGSRDAIISGTLKGTNSHQKWGKISRKENPLAGLSGIEPYCHLASGLLIPRIVKLCEHLRLLGKVSVLFY